MTPLQINKPEAKEHIDVVVYELQMLNECYIALQDQSNRFDTIVRIEAFLIHARNLIDFLAGGAYATDIKCTDFLDKDNNRIERILITISDDLKQKINKHCQHMTTDRLERQIGWPISSITETINKGMSEFASRLADSPQTKQLFTFIEQITITDASMFYRKSHESQV